MAKKIDGKAQIETYSQRIWRKLKGHHSGMAGLFIVALLLLGAVTAPLVSNDRPIIAHFDHSVVQRPGGATVFPAWTTYVDAWVPWPSLRNGLKSWEVTSGYFPFSDHYGGLDEQDWKKIEASGQISWSIWPLVHWSPTQFDPVALRLRPGEDPAHPAGTDDQGRDVLARLIHGTVVAMLVGLVSQAIAGVVGISLGLAAGYLGGWVDLILSRITEVVMCFPTFFLIIAVIAIFEPSIVNIMVVIGGVSWTRVFRLVRGEVLKVRRLDYVVAARALGTPSLRVMFRHVLPNAISPVFVAVAFGVANAVLAETSLAFLGFGDPSAPSWGEMVNQGRAYVSQGLWHLTVFPGLAIFVTLTGFNLFGQGLRDALDPKLRD